MPIDVQMPDGTIISGVPDNITQADLLARYKAFAPPAETPKVPESAGFSPRDTALALSQGVVGAGKSLVDVFGADSTASRSLADIQKDLSERYSSERQAEMARREAMQKQASKGTIGEEISTFLGGVAEAPVQSLAQGLGSIVPYVGTGIIGGIAKLGGATVKAINTVVGAAQGAGAVKGSIYDGVKQELQKSGMSEQEAAAKAAKAQEYLGDNFLDIIGGSALGGVGARVGVENLLTPGAAANLNKQFLARTGKAALAEAPLEAAQGGQEQLAINRALQNQGFDVGTFEGVAGAAARDAAVGAMTGATVGGIRSPSGDVAAPPPAAVTPAAVPPEARPVAPAVSQDTQAMIDEFRSIGMPPAAVAEPTVTEPTVPQTDEERNKAIEISNGMAATGYVNNILENAQQGFIRAGQEYEETGRSPSMPKVVDFLRSQLRPLMGSEKADRYIQYLTEEGGLLSIENAVNSEYFGDAVNGVSKIVKPISIGAKPPAQTPPTATEPAANVWESIQNRDRSTPASVAQMAKIANEPDYSRVSMSRDYGTGAPIVAGQEIDPVRLGRTDVVTGADGKKVPIQYGVIEAGEVIPSHNADGTKNPSYVDPNVPAFRAITNGRVAGLQAAYGQGTAEDYRAALLSDDLHGIDRNVIDGMENPMLVRIMPMDQVNKNTGDVSNTGAGLSFNIVEQAKNDTNRIDLGKVSFTDAGDITPQTVRDFIKAMPDTERGNLIDKQGNPTKQAVERVDAAIFQQAYNNDKLTELAFQAKDEEARNIVRALNMSASKAIRLGEAGDYDVRPLVNEAVEMAINARRNNISLSDAAAQADMTANPLANEIVQMFANNPRSAKAIGENLSNLFDNAYAEGSKTGEDMFGAVPKRPVDQLIRDSFAKTTEPDLFAEPEKPTKKPVAKPAEKPAVADGEPVANPEKIVKPDPKWGKIKTGQSVTLPLYQGRGESADKIYADVQIPIAGKGQYYAATGEDAANYGDVKKYNITLKNPLVITTDDEWKELAKKKAGWQYVNPFGLEEKELKKITQDLKNAVLADGYDSLVIRPSTYGDDAKTLFRVFAHGQAVVYKEQEAAAQVEEQPTTQVAVTETAEEPKQFKAKKSIEQIAKEIGAMDKGSQVAEWLVENAPNEAAKAIADRLVVNIKAIEDSGVPVVIQVLNGAKRNPYYGASGIATNSKKEISYFRVQYNGVNSKGQAEFEIGTKEAKEGKPVSGKPTGTRYSTLMHELLHVISQVQLDALIRRNFKGPEKVIYNELRSIYNAVKDKVESDKRTLPRDQWHPLLKQVGINNNRGVLEDIHELFVRSLTEKNAQSYLSGINMGKKTALTKLMEVFRKVIGLNPEYQTALDRIMIVSEQIFAQTPADMKRLAQTEGYDFPAIKKEDISKDQIVQDGLERQDLYDKFSPKLKGLLDKYAEAYKNALYVDQGRWAGKEGQSLKIKEGRAAKAYERAFKEEFPNSKISSDSVRMFVTRQGRFSDFDKRVNISDIKYEEVTQESDKEKPTAQARNYLGKQIQANWAFPEDNVKHWPGLSDQSINDFLYKIQDKQIDTKKAQQAIEKAAGEIEENINVYEKEQLYHGRTATGIRKFLLDELMPAIKELGVLKLTPQDLKDYLYNRHAPERNNKMNEVNKLDPITGKERKTPWELQDRASGISTADARAYLANLEPAKKAALEKVAKRFDEMVQGTQQILLNSGAEDKATIDAYNNTYKHYVPLFRIENDFTNTGGMGATGASKGFGVRGAFSKRAMGSEKEVQDILGNLIAQRERALIRAEKSKVGQALYGLALTNPNPDLWLPVNPDAIKSRDALVEELQSLGYKDAAQIADNLMEEPKSRYISKETKQFVDPDTGLPMQVTEESVKLKLDNLKRFGDNVFPVRINGKDRYIFFNKNDPKALRMVHSLMNLDADSLGDIEGIIAKATRWFASVNTQYNPIFGVVNLIRDIGGSTLNLSTTAIAGDQAKVNKNVIPAMRGILNVLRDERKGKTDTTGKWAKAFQDFREQGGQTGYRDSLIRTDEEKQIIEREINKMKSGNTKKAFYAVVGALSDFNDMMENSIRLSAYMAALDKGLSKQKAAILAKNLTVNFDKKGQLSARINAYFAFFNASVQGTARLAKTLKGPKGKAIIGGGIALGAAQAVILALAGFDEDEPPEFVRERNFVVPLPNGNFLTIPYPLGFNVLPNVGRLTTEFVLSGGKDPGKKVTALLGSVVEAFSPIGGSELSLQTISPTVVDPLVAIATNKDAFGRPIYKKDQATNPTPGYLRSRENASEFSKNIAYFLNLASGGTKYSKGYVSPTGDEIDYLIGQITGGVGRELIKTEQTVKAGITGEELPAYRIPLVGRFYGETQSNAAESQRFYNNIIKMADHENEVKGRIKNKEPVAEYLRENPEARLWQTANNVENQINALNKQKKEFIEKGLPKDRIKRIENQKAAIMKRFNDQLAQYEE
jgi:hypothetical protein